MPKRHVFKNLDNVLHILLRELGIGHAASNDIVNNRPDTAIQLLNNPYSLLGLVPYFSLSNAENIIASLVIIPFCANRKCSNIADCLPMKTFGDKFSQLFF